MTDKVIPFRVVQSDSENKESEEHTTVQMLNRALETEWENVCIVGIKKDTKELHVFPEKHYGNSVKRKTKEAKLAYNTAYGLSGYGIDNCFSSRIN